MTTASVFEHFLCKSNKMSNFFGTRANSFIRCYLISKDNLLILYCHWATWMSDEITESCRASGQLVKVKLHIRIQGRIIWYEFGILTRCTKWFEKKLIYNFISTIFIHDNKFWWNWLDFFFEISKTVTRKTK